MVKILFNEKRIFLTASLTAISSVKNALVIFSCDRESLLRNFDLLLISEITQLFVIGDVDQSLQVLRQQFTHIIAGGGLVENSRAEILLIYRRGRWDLPKGKTESGEAIAESAVREVQEETGLQSVSLSKELAVTYHIYFENNFIFKETFWFLMFSDDRFLRPQIDEGIKKAAWVRPAMVSNHLKNTYESIKDIYFCYSGIRL